MQLSAWTHGALFPEEADATAKTGAGTACRFAALRYDMKLARGPAASFCKARGGV